MPTREEEKRTPLQREIDRSVCFSASPSFLIFLVAFCIGWIVLEIAFQLSA
jgi:uncharacterized membrane protein